MTTGKFGQVISYTQNDINQDYKAYVFVDVKTGERSRFVVGWNLAEALRALAVYGNEFLGVARA